MESLNILHLSDFHFGNFKYPNPATLAIKIANRLSDDSKKVDVIIVSGDIFDGRSKNPQEDEVKAIGFFTVLIKKLIRKEICTNEFDEKSILFVPGNHDLVRSENGKKQYKKYDSFIKSFDGGKRIKNKFVVDKYNFIYDFPEKKIAILGFNSCRIEVEREKEEDLKWINEIKFDNIEDHELENIRTSIKKYKEDQFTWDDFGHIDSIEMDNVFETLKTKIPSYTDYNLIATFHHHFYPFPERQESNPDASFIRNYTEVVDQFQRFKVKLVLHGHKHMPVQRVISDKRYFDNPDSLIYVLAAGSIGCKGVDNLSFHWLRVFDKESIQLLEGRKYDFNNEEDDGHKTILLPPRRNEKELCASELKAMLQNEDPKLFQTYHKLTDDFEQIIQDSDTDQIIQTIGKLFTVFPEIDKSLRKEPIRIYLILLTVNYRVILLKNEYGDSESRLENLLKQIENEIIIIIKNKPFSKKVIDFLKAKTNLSLDEAYAPIIKNVSNTHKQYGAFVSSTLFLSDLFLNISRHGEYYFKREKLDLKINIKLNKGDFYHKLPSSSIEVRSEIDRRAIYLDFKCKDPTVHKIAVLIVKDFEMRLNKFEESLKTINLKLYYIFPKVKSDGYDLENFHFDAYIPTLLPLLTGDNLYNQKEVFIRELVQNAIDATLLRKKLQPKKKFITDINIELGEEKRDGKDVKYFRIRDNGIGMSKFTIERYFTSIGRSFYVSEEFKELKEDKNITYEAISNFGIGFLSSFMVSTEVLVKTKSIMGDEGLEIEIPNYEGCFFIKKTENINTVGTEITLFEDARKRFDFNEFESYIKTTFEGIPLNINITGNKKFEIESFKLHKEILQSVKENKLLFYVPFSEEQKSAYEMSWKKLYESKIDTFEKFGISFDFTKVSNDHFYAYIKTYNQGLKISQPFLPFEIQSERHSMSVININFPSSFIQLDVSRENILRLKTGIDLENIPNLLTEQVFDFFTHESKTLSNSYLFQIESIFHFIRAAKNSDITKIQQERYLLKTELKEAQIKLSIVKTKEIPKKYDKENIQYFSHTEDSFSNESIKFLKKISNLFDTHVMGTSKIKNGIDRHTEMMDTVKFLLMEELNKKFEIKEMFKTMELMVEVEMREIWYKMKKSKIFSNKEIRDFRQMFEDRQRGRIRIINEFTRGRLFTYKNDKILKNINMLDIGKNIYSLFFIYSLIKIHIRKERQFDAERQFDVLLNFPFLILKSFIYSTTKVSESDSFKCILDFKDYEFIFGES